MGHVFERGWLRLAVSPFPFPTLWPSPDIPTIMLLQTGRLGGLPGSALTVPGRDPRPEDERIQALLGAPTHGPRGPGAIRAYARRRSGRDRIRALRSRSSSRDGVASCCEKFSTAAAPSTGAARQPAGRPRGRGERPHLRERSPLRDGIHPRKLDAGARSPPHACGVSGWRRIGSCSARSLNRTFLNDQRFEERRVDDMIPRRWI